MRGKMIWLGWIGESHERLAILVRSYHAHLRLMLTEFSLDALSQGSDL